MNQLFTFFHGIVKKSRVNTIITNNRLRRLPNSQVPARPGYDTPELRSIFLQGWRACEHGREIYSNPYSNRENLIYSLHDAWEIGWLECYHHHPSRQTADEECYLGGWECSQQGRPLNENPYVFGSQQFNMWYVGWNDFVDNH